MNHVGLSYLKPIQLLVLLWIGIAVCLGLIPGAIADSQTETLTQTTGETRTTTVSGWFTGNLQEALNHAAGRLVMVKLSAEWCTPCHQLQKEIFGPDGPGLSLLEHVVALSVDFDSAEGQKITQTYAVLGIPALLFLKSDGTEKGRVLGYENAETFLKDTQRILVEEWDKISDLRHKLTLDPNNGRIMVDLAVELLGRSRSAGDGFETEALALLRAARAGDPNNEKRIAAAAVRTEGRYYVRVRQDFRKGEEVLLGGVHTWPDSPDADGLRYWAATAIWKGGDPHRAVALMIEAVEKTPERAMAHMFVADFILQMGGDNQLALISHPHAQEKSGLGEKHAKIAVTLDPKNGWNHYLVAKFAAADGRITEAQTAMERALEIEPNTAIYRRFADRIRTSAPDPSVPQSH